MRVAVLATAAALLLPSAPAAAQAEGGTTRVIVVLKAGADSRGVAREHAEAFAAQVSQVFTRAITGYAARLPTPLLERLRTDPRVAFITEDLPVTAAASVALASGDSVPAHVRRTGAATTTSVRQAANVAVAVIDTGIDLTHADINARAGINCIGGSSSNDDHGHGSHIAGTIGARNNGSGVVGVAPGTPVYAVKVLDSGGGGFLSNVVCGVDWVTANAAALGIRVANMSLTASLSNDNNCGNTNNDALHKSICALVAAGVTPVGAAGNGSGNFAGISPANYPEVLAVTAMADSNGQSGGGGTSACGYTDDRYTSFSKYASATQEINHTIAAPGACIYSTHKNGGYATISGTSMSAAHVSGSVALCFGDGGGSGPCTGKSPSAVIQQLRTTAANRPASYGFTGDPRNSPISGRYYGYLVWDGSSTGGTTTTSSTTLPPTTSSSTSSSTTSTTSSTTSTTSTSTTSTTAPGSTTTSSSTTLPPGTVAPSAPRSLYATQPASGPGVRLFWQAPLSGPVTGYQVWRYDPATQSGYAFYDTSPTTSYNDTVAGRTVPGRIYYYKVLAVNGSTAGPFSNYTRMVAK